jgi:hypothetical protein
VTELAVEQSDEAIEDQIAKAGETMHGRSRWPGMSYEQGVYNALLWATGQSDEPPMEDDE